MQIVGVYAGRGSGADHPRVRLKGAREPTDGRHRRAQAITLCGVLFLDQGKHAQDFKPIRGSATSTHLPSDQTTKP
ncbi:MAG: hypothetical protein KC996_06960 [Phycisphaerales bacterium]|nr:hypothetical protein [Phycisphaerales bacterium]